eukprot:scaffold455129_cov56-Prasinocladus_malaysianus.AAC.1
MLLSNAAPQISDQAASLHINTYFLRARSDEAGEEPQLRRCAPAAGMLHDPRGSIPCKDHAGKNWRHYEYEYGTTSARALI